MYIKQAINEYISWKAIRSPRAAVIYKPYLNRLAAYKNKDTKDIINQDIVEFNHFLSTKYNPPTVAYSCMVLKNFFRYLNSTQESTLNTLLIQNPKYARKQRVGVSDDEFKAMCSVLNPYEIGSLQKLTVIRFLYETGVRVSELCDLDVAQISSVENFTSIETKKNKQLRWIMWSEDFHKDILLRWIGSRISVNEKPSLFFSLNKYNSGRINSRTVERWVRETARMAKIEKKITPHMFRHAKAHRMKAAGADLKDIQAMLGHISPYSALLYLNFDKNEQLANAKKFL